MLVQNLSWCKPMLEVCTNIRKAIIIDVVNSLYIPPNQPISRIIPLCLVCFFQTINYFPLTNIVCFVGDNNLFHFITQYSLMDNIVCFKVYFILQYSMYQFKRRYGLFVQNVSLIRNHSMADVL